MPKLRSPICCSAASSAGSSSAEWHSTVLTVASADSAELRYSLRPALIAVTSAASSGRALTGARRSQLRLMITAGLPMDACLPNEGWSPPGTPRSPGVTSVPPGHDRRGTGHDAAMGSFPYRLSGGQPGAAGEAGLAGAEQAVLHGEQGGAGPGRHPHFAVHPLDVMVAGLRGATQLTGDLLGGQATG